MNSLKPSFTSAIFNTSAFNSGIYLTKEIADQLYLPLSSGRYLQYLYGITDGVGQANKALVLDSNRDINNINNLTASTLTGTLLTASQPNITSLGTLTSLNTGNITLNGTLITATATELNYNDITTIGTGQASKALILDSNRDITNIRNLTATNLTGIIQTASQPNITSIGTLSSLSSSSISTNSITLNGTLITSSATEINYLDISSVGTAEANKALVVDLSRNITNINSIGISSITLGGTAITATGNEINYLAGASAGTATSFKTMIPDINGDISNIRNFICTNLTGTLQSSSQPNITSLGTLSSLSTGNITLNGTLITSSATELNYNDITTIGTAQASKALILDSSRNITNINNLTTTGIINANSLNINSIAITSTATKLNYTDITTIGTAEASKALVLDSSLNIVGLRRIGFSGNRNATSTTEYRNIDITSATYTNTYTATSGTDATHGYSNYIGQPTISATNLSVSTTNASTLFIQGQPLAGTNMTITNVYSLYVNSGNVFMGGNLNTNTLSINNTLITSTATKLNYTDITTLGTTEASKFLTVDASRNIININSLTATSLTGTLQTSAQTNITSLGTLTGLTSSGAISITNATTSTNATTGALIVSGGVGIGGALNITGNINGTIGTASQTNITSLGTLTGLTSSGAVSITNATTSTSATTGALTVSGGVGINDTLNMTNDFSNYSGDIVLSQSKSIIFARTVSTKDIACRISSEGSVAMLLTASRGGGYVKMTTNNTSGAVNSGNIFTINNSVATNILTISGQNAQIGINTNSPSYGLDVQSSLNCTSFYINGSQIISTATELNYLDLSVALGLAEASKALVVDANRDIGNIRNLSVTTSVFTTQNGGTGFSHQGGTAGSMKLESWINSTVNSSYTFFGATTNHGLALTTNNNGRILIDNSGYVGINTTSGLTNARCTITQAGNQLRCTDGTNTFQVYSDQAGSFPSDVIVGAFSNSSLSFMTNNTRRMVINASNGYIAMGNSAPTTASFPLDVFQTTTSPTSYNYWYVRSDGASGSITSTAPTSCTMRLSGRLLCVGEVDIISDIRTKQDIQKIDEKYSLDFIKKIQPKTFTYRSNPESNLEFGYIAQDLLKNGFGDLCMLYKDDKAEEYIDEDGFVSPENHLYTFTRQQVIGLLHNAMKNMLERIEKLEEQLNLSKYTCQICNVDVYNRPYDILRHEKTARHKKNVERINNHQ